MPEKYKRKRNFIKSKKIWKDYQKDYWTEVWEKSEYSIDDYLTKDKWVSVKNSPILPLIVDRVGKRDKILEAGCGLGQWVIYLSDLGYDIVGVDFSESLIETLSSKFHKYKFEVNDVTNFSYQNNTFDCILSWGVVEHFEAGPDIALNEAYRILSSGGLMFVTVPCQNLLYRILYPIYFVKKAIIKSAALRIFFNKKPYKYSFYQYDFKKSTFESLLAKSGFEVINILPISHEFGFATEMKKNLFLNFFKNKTLPKWTGLTKTGQVIAKILNKLNKWFTPHMMLFVVRK